MLCSKCNYDNDEGDVYCAECGSRIDGYLKCRRCGIYNPPANVFCENCGEKLKLDRECKRCGNIVKETAKFCGKCGAKLDVPEEITASEDTPIFSINKNNNVKKTPFVAFITGAKGALITKIINAALMLGIFISCFFGITTMKGTILTIQFEEVDKISVSAIDYIEGAFLILNGYSEEQFESEFSELLASSEELGDGDITEEEYEKLITDLLQKNNLYIKAIAALSTSGEIGMSPYWTSYIVVSGFIALAALIGSGVFLIISLLKIYLLLMKKKDRNTTTLSFILIILLFILQFFVINGAPTQMAYKTLWGGGFIAAFILTMLSLILGLIVVITKLKAEGKGDKFKLIGGLSTVAVSVLCLFFISGAFKVSYYAPGKIGGPEINFCSFFYNDYESMYSMYDETMGAWEEQESDQLSQDIYRSYQDLSGHYDNDMILLALNMEYPYYYKYFDQTAEHHSEYYNNYENISALLAIVLAIIFIFDIGKALAAIKKNQIPRVGPEIICLIIGVGLWAMLGLVCSELNIHEYIKITASLSFIPIVSLTLGSIITKISLS